MPGPAPTPTDVLIERRRVVEPDGCHSLGGGRKRYPAVGGARYRVTVARHLAGLAPGDPRVVRHTCDRDWCINPEHLLTGTQAENLADMVERRRSNRGERHWNVRLTPEQVAAIRADPRSSRQVAPEYGVAARQIRRIRQGVRWR